MKHELKRWSHFIFGTYTKKTIIIICIYYLTVNHLSLSVIFDFEIFDHYIFNTFIQKSRAILVFLISISESVLE